MDFSSQVVPAVIVLAANLMSGKHHSMRWELVTAIFGWGAAIGVLLLVFLTIANLGSPAVAYSWQLFVFCLLTALSRDYEKVLRPFFRWNR
jgi:hypothetical protein